MSDGLFPEDGLRVAVAPAEELTAGERLRRRQAARIAAGCHPLPVLGLRLHPDAPRDATKDDGRDYPRCGTCARRVLLDHHNRTYPKCSWGAGSSGWPMPRASASEATDVRAWWPACVDYAAREAS